MGMFLRSISERTTHLRRSIDEYLMVHNLYERFTTSDIKTRALDNLKELEKMVDLEARGINGMIKSANKLLSITVYEKRIQLIDVAELRRLFKLRFKEIYKDKSLQNLGNENFKLKLDELLLNHRKALQDFLDSVDKEYTFEGFSKLKDNYKVGIGDAIDIMSIAQFKESVFVVGRIIEELLDKLLRSAIRSKKIKKIIIGDTRYDSKIGILKGAKIIDEKTFHELNSVRIDRNKSGHPTRKRFTFKDNKLVIERGIAILQELQDKL